MQATALVACLVICETLRFQRLERLGLHFLFDHEHRRQQLLKRRVRDALLAGGAAQKIERDAAIPRNE